jgi:hypothetical protein
MKVSKDIYRKDEMTWQMFRDFLLDVTDSNGVVDKSVLITAKKHKLYRWAKVSCIVKRGNKIFNGESDVHINTVAKNYFHKYITFEHAPHRGQTKLPFASPPHYIKDAIKGTVTVVPQGKEKEFIKSTKVVQPQQRREFSFGWGFINIKF